VRRIWVCLQGVLFRVLTDPITTGGLARPVRPQTRRSYFSSGGHSGLRCIFSGAKFHGTAVGARAEWCGRQCVPDGATHGLPALVCPGNFDACQFLDVDGWRFRRRGFHFASAMACTDDRLASHLYDARPGNDFVAAANHMATTPLESIHSQPKGSDTRGATQHEGLLGNLAQPYFRSLMPLAFLGYGGMVAMQTLWVTPWMVHVAGFSPAQAATGLFWISIAMLLTYWMWGLVNPLLAKKGIHADWLLTRGIPLSIVPVIVVAYLGARATEAAPWLLGAYCVLATVNSLAQPAVGVSFRSELAGRALSAYNLVVFCGVFAVQWGIGLIIDRLLKLDWSEVEAYRGAWVVYALSYLAAYLFFLQHKKDIICPQQQHPYEHRNIDHRPCAVG